MELIVTDEIKEKDRQEIHSGLHEYNIERIEDKHPRDLGIYLENPSGKKLAGLIGETHGNWCEVEFLWVAPEQRGQGIGSAVLQRAEDVARERGCKYVFLNTFGFQAPEFYKKKGYQEVFAQREYPLTGTRHYFIKTL